MKKSYFLLFLLFALAMTDYQLAKLGQRFLLDTLPFLSNNFAVALPWILICVTPVALSVSEAGLRFDLQETLKNWLAILVPFLLVTAGLLAFVFLGVTKYFHGVKSPVIFFVVTPIVEELLFRGWIYGKLEKLGWYPIFGSALLFGLHHLQYFNYHPTKFALFQITYTFLLGILFGFMRKKSKSIYPSFLTHVLINWVTIYF